MNLKAIIDEIPDFPKKGILFRDISPLLRNPSAISYMVDEFAKRFHPKDFDIVAGIESRGFPLALAVGIRHNKGMIMIRKQGKLPGKTKSLSYSTEYSKTSMEIQTSSVKQGQKVLVCDDLLATGGTAKTAARLIEKIGGKVTGFAFIIELTNLRGSKKISNYKHESLVKY